MQTRLAVTITITLQIEVLNEDLLVQDMLSSVMQYEVVGGAGNLSVRTGISLLLRCQTRNLISVLSHYILL